MGIDARGVRWLVLIIGVAVGLRVAVGLMHPFWFPDSVDYDGLARGMLAGRGYEIGGLFATRMPGYPVFLAAVYGIGGGVKAVMVVQALVGGGIVWMTYLIGRRVGEVVGLVAAVLVAVDPLSVAFSAAVLSENLFTLMLMVGVWICLRLVEGCNEVRDPVRHDSGYRPVARGGGFWWWVLLGVVWGIGVYLRGSVIWCLVPMGVLVVLFLRKRGIGLAGLGCAVGVMFLVLMPWQVRNFGIFHEHYFQLTTLEGISLYEAVYPGADGGPKQDVIALPPEMRAMNEAQRNDEWMRRGRAYFFAEPGRMAELAVRKVGRTWTPLMNAGEFRNWRVQAVMGLWQVPLFGLAVMGIFAGGVMRRMKWLLLMPVFYFMAVHAVFLGSVRYRVPLMPLVCVFAAAGLVMLMRRWRGAKRDAVAAVQ